MTRIVIETSEKVKDALSLKLDELGKSYKDWFDESLDLTINHTGPIDEEYQLNRAVGPGCLIDSKKIREEVESSDWAFSSCDSSYLTHSIHPYPAKYIPQIPSNFIRRLSLYGDTVLDPFGGSGTTATESARLGRKSISLDANPLATLLVMVKTTVLTDAEKRQMGLLYEAVKSYLNNSDSLPEVESLSKYIPTIPNHEKWFASSVTVELALICKLIDEITSSQASNVAKAAMSRIIVRVSFQDSETRYVSKPREVKTKSTLKAYLDSLTYTLKKLIQFESVVDSPQTSVYLGDSRESLALHVEEESVGLIVTSPPYANATDYHLYHRFRIFWLGFNPRNLADVEIGSHLKHQRKKSGFDEYLNDMTPILEQCFKVLISGRYAVFIVGDSIFKDVVYDTAKELLVIADQIGFEHVITHERPLPENKRSFAKPARRARGEKILILRKPQKMLSATFFPPRYKLQGYEETLRLKEISKLLNVSEADISREASNLKVDINSELVGRLSRPSLSSMYAIGCASPQKTYQAIVEDTSSLGKRKESKYVTHGIHTYKGKFYPQLAKALINISGVNEGGTIVDPFCGSGTVLLEAFLNGYNSIGSDMNPLAAKISKAKIQILQMDYADVKNAFKTLLRYFEEIGDDYAHSTSEFPDSILDDVFSWFPVPVVHKVNFILHKIRLFGDARLVNFLEAILSECIREVSQQDPKDLRIRRRSESIKDAPVFDMFCKHLSVTFKKIHGFRNADIYALEHVCSNKVFEQDNRSRDYLDNLGIKENTIDLVITSPPYATALPYIDTDRLSLLTILGMPVKDTKILERDITGSREIQKKAKDEFDDLIKSDSVIGSIPLGLLSDLRHILEQNLKSGAGFRKLNTPAVLLRYFIAMEQNLSNVHKMLKPGAKAYYVIGDSKTKVNDEWFPIRTTFWLSEIAKNVGFHSSVLLDISVTTENLINQKNAITENCILQLSK